MSFECGQSLFWGGSDYKNLCNEKEVGNEEG